jgi:hypothetical protein
VSPLVTSVFPDPLVLINLEYDREEKDRSSFKIVGEIEAIFHYLRNWKNTTKQKKFCCSIL